MFEFELTWTTYQRTIVKILTMPDDMHYKKSSWPKNMEHDPQSDFLLKKNEKRLSKP